MAFGGNAFGSNYSETGCECYSKKKDYPGSLWNFAVLIDSLCGILMESYTWNIV